MAGCAGYSGVTVKIEPTEEFGSAYTRMCVGDGVSRPTVSGSSCKSSILHKKGDLFVCLKCGSKFTEYRLWRYHELYERSKRRKYKCAYCGYGYNLKCHLIRHMVHHGGEGTGQLKFSYKCEVCTYKTTFLGNLKTHLLAVHGKADDADWTCLNESGVISRQDNQEVLTDFEFVAVTSGVDAAPNDDPTTDPLEQNDEKNSSSRQPDSSDVSDSRIMQSSLLGHAAVQAQSVLFVCSENGVALSQEAKLEQHIQVSLKGNAKNDVSVPDGLHSMGSVKNPIKAVPRILKRCGKTSTTNQETSSSRQSNAGNFSDSGTTPSSYREGLVPKPAQPMFLVCTENRIAVTPELNMEQYDRFSQKAMNVMSPPNGPYLIGPLENLTKARPRLLKPRQKTHQPDQGFSSSSLLNPMDVKMPTKTRPRLLKPRQKTNQPDQEFSSSSLLNPVEKIPTQIRPRLLKPRQKTIKPDLGFSSSWQPNPGDVSDSRTTNSSYREGHVLMHAKTIPLVPSENGVAVTQKLNPEQQTQMLQKGNDIGARVGPQPIGPLRNHKVFRILKRSPKTPKTGLKNAPDVINKIGDLRSDQSSHQKITEVKSDSTMLFCSHCDFNCSDGSMLKYHMSKSHTKEESKGLSSSRELVNNNYSKGNSKTRKKARGQDNFACTHCDFTGISMASIMVHNKRFHAAPSKIEEIETEDMNQHCCSLCTLKCADESVLAFHMRVAHSKNFSCRKCDFGCNTLPALRNHHSGVHGFDAPIQKKMEFEGGHRCPECSLLCVDKSVLERHIEIVHVSETHALDPDEILVTTVDAV